MSKARILIVEDNALNRKLERDVLQHNGYATLEAETAEQAMRLARKSCGAYFHGHLASRNQRNRGVGSVADRTRHARYPGDRGYRRSRQLKGLHHPVPVYRVLWIKSAQPF
jgi:CheY-like chemotaxis protein